MSDEYEGYLRWKVSAQQQIDWYREEVRELKAENAKLRQQLADVTESMGRVEERCAKLRELVRDTLPFIAEEAGFCTADCFVYPACCDYDGDEECPAVTRIHERARELGVDV